MSNTKLPTKTGARKLQSISLQPVEWLAVQRHLAPDERGNVSAAVARLIAKEMTARLGPDWRTHVSKEDA